MHILFLGPPCPPVENCLAKQGHTVTRTEEALSLPWVREQNFDFGVSYRYKKIIRPDIIEYFAGKLINMHISLLPWNRGMDPNLWSHIENTPKGVTIHRVDAGIDTGDILLQREVALEPATDTFRTSYEKLSRAVEDLFIKNAWPLLADALPAAAQAGPGSFHYAQDKTPYLALLDKGWDTKVCNFITVLRLGGGICRTV